MASQLQQASGSVSPANSGTPSGLGAAAAAAAAAGQTGQTGNAPVVQTPVEEPLRSRIDDSNSPYAWAQVGTPVLWQLLDQEAIDRAKRENKLIFLHVGFLACHYCHMTRQDSFSNPAVAAILNTSFIPIIVDREERPDIDAIYWNYLQLVNSSAGWPINVFLTPDLEPVFGGTYWPGPGAESSVHDGHSHSHSHNHRHDGHDGRDDDDGSPDGSEDEPIGFLGILQKLRQSWVDRETQCRDEARETVVQLRKFAAEGTLGPRGLLRPAESEGAGYLSRDLDLDIDQLDEAYVQLKKTFDPVNGGFGVVPKFVTPAKYRFLLELGSLPRVVQDIVGPTEVAQGVEMALFTLRMLRNSGLHDRLGGGFSRASHTINWTLPHFEKLVPDNALLLGLYLDAWLWTRAAGAEEFRDVVDSLADYLSSEPICLEGGGFASSEAADSLYRRGDSHTREGAYYVWTRREFDAVVGGPDSDSSNFAVRAAAAYWNVLEHGNVDREDDPNDEFINQNVLYITRDKDASEVARQFGISRDDVLRAVRTSQQRLAAHRARERVRPPIDAKRIVAGNACVITALARTGAALLRGGVDLDGARGTRYLTAATAAAQFIRDHQWDATERQLYRIYSDNRRGTTRGFVEDYAFLVEGLLELYEATGTTSWLQWADELQKTQIDLFYDRPDVASTSTHSASGGFYRTAASESMNILRLKDGMDTTLPAANGVAAANLFRLGSLLGDAEYTHLARETIHAFEVEMMQHAWLFPSLLAQVVPARLGGLSFAVVGAPAAAATTPTASDLLAAYFRRPRGGLRSLVHVTTDKSADQADKWLADRQPAVAALLAQKPAPGSYVLRKGVWQAATAADLIQEDAI